MRIGLACAAPGAKIKVETARMNSNLHFTPKFILCAEKADRVVAEDLALLDLREIVPFEDLLHGISASLVVRKIRREKNLLFAEQRHFLSHHGIIRFGGDEDDDAM